MQERDTMEFFSEVFMTVRKVCLASDNFAPAHPLILQAIVDANEGYAGAYGSDPWTEEAGKRIQEVFKSPCKVFFVPTGTGSNVLALKLCCRPHESVLGTDIAHFYCQESGAPEALIGCKLLPIPHRNGKLTPNAVLKKLKEERAFGKHATSPRVLSLTQPTEVGTVYTLDELSALSQLCREEKLLLHIDGSRLYNAAVALKSDLHEIYRAVPNLDILSLGGTKNGLMGAEALLIFNPQLQEGSDYLQKQTLQLSSKMRYLSCQYIPFFQNQLWHTLAKQANHRAQEIASIIQTIPPLSLNYPVETNQIFVTAPAPWIPLIQEKISCLLWDQGKNELRLIASWNTSEKDIQDFKNAMKEIARNSL